MVLNLLLLLLGLGLLIAGGELLIRGAVQLARTLGVPTILIGMTVVAFGTSTPELVVNLTAAAEGDTSIGFGNIVGSNIANIGLLLGLTALVRPLVVQRSIITREIPMLLLTCGSAIALGLDSWFSDAPPDFGRGDGLMLLMLFGVFLYYSFADALRHRSSDAFLSEADQLAAEHMPPQRQRWRAPLFVLIGLAVLIVGGRLTLSAAVQLAQALGMPEVVIGLTIVAVGTSLPEMVTCLLAARRNQADVAIGTVIGSNIYNLLFIQGLTVAITPARLPEGAAIDLLVMSGFSLVLLPFTLTQQRLTRWEGAGLLAGYIAYIVWLAARGMS